MWCDKNSKTSHKLKGEFDSFREWCTKDNLAHHIRITTSLNKVPLALGDAKWDENKNNYNSSATDQNQITDSKGVAIAKAALQDIQTLQAWCFTNAKGLYISDTDKSFVAYKEWCTKSTNT
ncbi:hypothetical protein HF1_01870 [Mycoplasma haemofelis str. Langford 1]|uniref:Uncharacterized protein n=1 Tax=Mycoplasma haemofelis (strain Langford 1) TaxID=941640 RepID=E8ZKM9_MYCHL|nr:hypothetical protein HF1_01870 [Mycoplasma haemofelis str. Langford 1]